MSTIVCVIPLIDIIFAFIDPRIRSMYIKSKNLYKGGVKVKPRKTVAGGRGLVQVKENKIAVAR